jgi:hypothetical protein
MELHLRTKYKNLCKNAKIGWAQWLMPVIPVTQDAQFKRIVVQI